MRLTAEEIRVILDEADHAFGTGVEVWVFGSRVHDDRRGGDIDLMVVTDHLLSDKATHAASFAAQLQTILGDQRIDVVIDDGHLDMPIVRTARQSGVRLTYAEIARISRPVTDPLRTL